MLLKHIIRISVPLLFIDIILMNQIVQSCKSFKPPIYPKYEKASTVRLDLPRNSHLPYANKIQREENNTVHGCNDSPSHKNMPSAASIPSLPPSTPSNHTKDEIRKHEYQQYTRKNYFKSKRNLADQTNLQSHLTQKVVPACRSASGEEKRLKSKSALNYAKYFIKHVSIIPTEPSSNQPMQPTQDSAQCPEEDLKKNVEKSDQKKTTSIFSHEDRQKSRKKISERLKSIKNIRCKPNKVTCSIEKQKQSQKTPKKSTKKIAGNIGSLEGNESNVLRMKARARNKRIILKVKQFHSKAPEDDMCLMVSSKIDRSFSDRKEIIEKVELHLELLNLLPAYVKQFKELYEESQCWEELIFLVYKKFYIQRLKVQLSLGDEEKNEDLSYSNPYRFNFCQLLDKDLDNFKNSLQCLRLEQKLTCENASIKQSLRNLYNHIIEKSGKHVNLYDVDNFSQEIYYLMNEQLKLLMENQGDALQAVRQKRIVFIIKCCLMIAFLNGQNVEIDAILTENSWTYRMKNQYNAFIQYYTS